MKHSTPIKILLGFNLAIILFHLAILLKFIPYTITWGGRLQSDTEMYVFETISIFINAFFGLVLLMKAEYLQTRFSERITNTILWIYLILFLLNTVGNIIAQTYLEKTFSLLTLGFAILLWRILTSKAK
jgi:hypothetical protein